MCVCVCVCVCVYISGCVQTVYELPLLPNNTASETFLNQSEWCEVLTAMYCWGAGVAATGAIRHIGRNVLRPIHIYHAVPMPCRAAKGLECVFPI